MMQARRRMKQLVDWRAAIWSGVISGAVFLVVAMALTAAYVGSPWVMTRLISSVLLGKGVLPPPPTFTVGTVLVAVVVHGVLSVSFACLIAYVFHRWGLIVGILGGAVFGLALYFVNFYTVSFFFPWFFPMRSWIMVASHVVFGALAGGIYEALEVEYFVPIEN
jgi:hypothetical protein